MTTGTIARELWWTNQKLFSPDIIPPWFYMLVYHLGVNNRPVGGRSSETYSHPIDRAITIITRSMTTKLVSVQ
jgi:hypothetical protein